MYWICTASFKEAFLLGERVNVTTAFVVDWLTVIRLSQEVGPMHGTLGDMIGPTERTIFSLSSLAFTGMLWHTLFEEPVQQGYSYRPCRVRMASVRIDLVLFLRLYGWRPSVAAGVLEVYQSDKS